MAPASSRRSTRAGPDGPDRGDGPDRWDGSDRWDDSGDLDDFGGPDDFDGEDTVTVIGPTWGISSIAPLFG